ncbi:glucosamine-6-phosphate deaminase [Frondihabitans cladoniiphilus]|uniref:Glucosamine-6-phosphate deaminase n=1 Tax=Frondihabitans cladoniiphilus TaxID=715785 RepID=A0ABP8WBU3_9MICO
MKIVIQHSPSDAGRVAARQIASTLRLQQNGIIGLATGSSPQPLYEALAALVRAGEVSFASTRGFALDEYVGIDPDHPESYHSIIARDAIAPLGMDPRLVRVPSGSGSVEEVDEAAVEYEAAIREAGGVDVQILGIGANGHIGFNEPGSAADSVTRRVDLAPETIAANSRFFPSVADVPTQAVSQGLGTILSARAIVLVANGSEKAQAVRDALEGPIEASCPASFLREHDDVTFCLDEQAAALLSAETRARSVTTALDDSTALSH